MTPFFVQKKGDMIRLVWDCRLANLLFRLAPQVDLGAGDCLKDLDLSRGKSVWISQADVKNCFYQICLPQWLIPCFCLDPIPKSKAWSLGTQHDYRGISLEFGLAGLVHPALAVLPMGWSWAFWVVQKLHEGICDSVGFHIFEESLLAGPCRR